MNWSWKNTRGRYGSLSIGMHWLMLLLLIGVYAAINLHDLAPKGSDLRAAFKTWHFMLGLAVFVLVGVRLALSFLSGRAPGIEPAAARWQLQSAHLVHAALYVFLIGMPLLGWLALSAAGKPIPFFGLEWPALIGRDKGLASTVKDIHEVIGTFGYYLIGVHALAALFHHYVLRDNTLVRMLPGARTGLRPGRVASHDAN
ncbi:MAG: cytochrome b [Burkholderiales bacterium]|nr:cytochrome b [Burkholderiales bacterium]